MVSDRIYRSLMSSCSCDCTRSGPLDPDSLFEAADLRDVDNSHPRRYYSHIMASERIQRRVERLLDQMEQESDQQNWQVVRDLGDEVLGLAPDNADALAMLSAAERRLSSTEYKQKVPPAATANISATSAQEAERRQLTVMFCDLQGSTALSQRLDPEDLRDVIRSYQEVCAGPVSRFEGHIAKYLGDGLLVYFGYPQAHEDDPQRAVRAGLAILDDMGSLNARLKADMDLELTVRIGIHTGLVVAGEMGGGDTLEELAIVGETPNIAARIEGAALPNSVVVSNITANLIQGFFLNEAMGPHELKGISEPVELFRVLEESGAQTRFDVAAAAELTPLVGREKELGLLLDRWEQAKEGLGQVVLLSGEAGIGKSRLVNAVIEGLADQTHILRHVRCSPYHQNSAWYPVADYLERWIGYDRDESPEDKLIKLEKALEGFRFPLTESVPLLAPLLSTPLNDRYPSLDLSPDEYREKTVELLVELLTESPTGKPVALIIEDLQWADPSTLALFGLLIDQVAKIQVLVLVVVRSDFSPEWRNRAPTTQIALNRLTPSLTTEMVGQLTGGKELPEEVISQVAGKSDGVPIFVEELTRMVLESGLLRELDDRYELTGPLPSLAIPSTLQDALTARLDRLAAARELIQLGAVVGRDFSYELLRVLTPLEDEALRSQLQQLVDADFLYQRGLPPDATYTFKHGLVQDAAYGSLLRSRRQQLHQQVAEVLEERFPETKETAPELLAHHCSEAGLIENAISYWKLAGERALSAYAYEGASVHFNRALAALGCPVAEGWKGELTDETAAILFGLVQCQSALLERGQLQEVRTNLNWVLDYYLGTGNVVRAAAAAVYPIPPIGDMGDTIRNLDRIISMVPTESIDAGVLHARYGLVLGVEVGDYEGAQREFEQALAISRQEMDADLEMRTLADAARVDTYNHRWTSSLEKSLRAVELAQNAGNTRLELAARYRAAWALLTLGDAKAAVEQSTPVLEIAENLRDRYWMVNALWLSELMARLFGQWQSAVEFSERGLAIWPRDPRLLGSRMLLEYETGNFENGQYLLDRLIQAMDSTRPGASLEHVNVASIVPLVSRISGDTEQLDRAGRAGEAVVASTDATEGLVKDVTAGMGLTAVLHADSLMAQKLYPELSAESGLILFASVSGDRLLGLLAGTMNNHNDAATHFEAGLGFCRRSGYSPELAWTCCDYSDTLLQRGGEGDKAKAIAMLEESLAISRELGMRPLMERALSRREMLNE